MLRFHGLNIEKVYFNFTLEDDNVSFCKDFFRSKNIQLKDTLIGILPLAGWSLKSWPIEKWNRLADILKRRWKIRTISLGKLPDNELGRRIASELSDNIISADNTTLSQAKALLRYCKAFIGPDSSFLHLGSCMGVETVGLYGPTSNNRFYPYFHQHNIISSKNKLECMPCYPGNKPSCNTKEVKHDFGLCMQRIKVEDVVSLVKKRLNLK
jgi:heptosyltransferase-2